ncbi:hypothetical protein MRX96_058597 [Rhipicephalus microplus]
MRCAVPTKAKERQLASLSVRVDARMRRCRFTRARPDIRFQLAGRRGKCAGPAEVPPPNAISKRNRLSLAASNYAGAPCKDPIYRSARLCSGVLVNEKIGRVTARYGAPVRFRRRALQSPPSPDHRTDPGLVPPRLVGAAIKNLAGPVSGGGDTAVRAHDAQPFGPLANAYIRVG